MENTIVQYLFPFLPVFASALPLSGDKSARTTHRVEKSSAELNQVGDHHVQSLLGVLTGLPIDPFWNCISASITPNLNFENG